MDMLTLLKALLRWRVSCDLCSSSRPFFKCSNYSFVRAFRSEVKVEESRTYSGSKLLFFRLGMWGGTVFFSITAFQLMSTHQGWALILPIYPFVILFCGSLCSINFSRSASFVDMNCLGYSSSL